MATRHWQASYGNAPREINPDAYPSVTAMLPTYRPSRIIGTANVAR